MIIICINLSIKIKKKINFRNTSQCLVTNECLYRNGGCNGDCVSTNGSYHCVCADDLVLAADKRTCVTKNSRCLAFQTPLYSEVNISKLQFI